MSLSKSKCWYLYNCLHFFKAHIVEMAKVLLDSPLSFIKVTLIFDLSVKFQSNAKK
jgi:hypothetical protein